MLAAVTVLAPSTVGKESASLLRTRCESFNRVQAELLINVTYKSDWISACKWMIEYWLPSRIEPNPDRNTSFICKILGDLFLKHRTNNQLINSTLTNFNIFSQLILSHFYISISPGSRRIRSLERCMSPVAPLLVDQTAPPSAQHCKPWSKEPRFDKKRIGLGAHTFAFKLGFWFWVVWWSLTFFVWGSQWTNNQITLNTSASRQERHHPRVHGQRRLALKPNNSWRPPNSLSWNKRDSFFVGIALLWVMFFVKT